MYLYSQFNLSFNLSACKVVCAKSKTINKSNKLIHREALFDIIFLCQFYKYVKFEGQQR